MNGQAGRFILEAACAAAANAAAQKKQKEMEQENDRHCCGCTVEHGGPGLRSLRPAETTRSVKPMKELEVVPGKSLRRKGLWPCWTKVTLMGWGRLMFFADDFINDSSGLQLFMTYHHERVHLRQSWIKAVFHNQSAEAEAEMAAWKAALQAGYSLRQVLEESDSLRLELAYKDKFGMSRESFIRQAAGGGKNEEAT